MESLSGKINGSTDVRKFDDGIYTSFAVRFGIGWDKFDRFIIKGIHENLIQGKTIDVVLSGSEKHGLKSVKNYTLIGRKGYTIYERCADD